MFGVWTEHGRHRRQALLHDDAGEGRLSGSALALTSPARSAVTRVTGGSILTSRRGSILDGVEAKCMLTTTWQFVILPAVPVYCRRTPDDFVPFFSNPVSSMIHACGWDIARVATSSRRRRTSWSDQSPSVARFMRCRKASASAADPASAAPAYAEMSAGGDSRARSCLASGRGRPTPPTTKGPEGGDQHQQ